MKDIKKNKIKNNKIEDGEFWPTEITQKCIRYAQDSPNSCLVAGGEIYEIGVGNEKKRQEIYTRCTRAPGELSGF